MEELTDAGHLKKQSLLRHVAILAGIMLFVGLVYIRIPGTYFCAYDDFVEVHRAAFEDTDDPTRVLTTTHFTSYKYRPLNRGLNLLTYWVGNGNASFFRSRNLAFHLLNIILVYILGWILFRQILVSGTAALLFGLHPLANQAVVGAVMTNTAAHTLFLLSLICFLVSLRKTRMRLLWLAIAMVSGWLGIFLYEAGIVIFPLMAVFLLIDFVFMKERPIDRRYLLVLTIGAVILLGIYFGLRSRYVPYSSRQAVPNIKVMIKSTVMYAGALVLPVDSVLANQWFGTPLPSEIELSSTSKIWWIAIPAFISLVVVIAMFLLRRSVRSMWAAIGSNHLLLILSIAASLSILIIFTDKPSETYMYLPVAFVALLFSSLLQIAFLRRRGAEKIYLVIVFILSILFVSATWVRNGLVARCGATAAQIVAGLKQDRLRDGVWFIWLAPFPGEPRSQRYGMYGWRGIDTVGATAVEPATQLANSNRLLAAALVYPQLLKQYCPNPRSVCFLVHDNGVLAEQEEKLSAK